MTQETTPKNTNTAPFGSLNKNERNCIECNTLFNFSTCGSGKCWCDKYPQILQYTPGNECLCEPCLKNKIIQTIQEYVKHLNPEKIKQIQSLGPSRRPQKDIDYTLTPEGYKKFTAWYLLRQGGCCGNDCSNCPY